MEKIFSTRWTKYYIIENGYGEFRLYYKTWLGIVGVLYYDKQKDEPYFYHDNSYGDGEPFKSIDEAKEALTKLHNRQNSSTEHYRKLAEVKQKVFI